MQVTRLQCDRDAAVRKEGGQQHERIIDQRGGTRCSRKGSEGAGNQRFRTARGARGGREAGNQGTLPHGNSREHGGTGNQRAGVGDCRCEERRRAAGWCGHEAVAGGGGCGGAAPSSVREGIGPVPLSATDPGRKMRGAVDSDQQQLAAAEADRIETSREDSRPNCDPAVRLRLGAISALARDPRAGTDCLSPSAVRRIINEDVMGSPTAVCSPYRELHEPSVTHTGRDLIERMERQCPTAGRSAEGSPDIDVERHSCGTADQQA